MAMSSANDGYRNGCDATARAYEDQIAALKASHQAEIAKLIADTLRAASQHESSDYIDGRFDWSCQCGATGHWGPDAKDSWGAHILTLTAQITAQAEERDRRVRLEARIEEAKLCAILAGQSLWADLANRALDLEILLSEMPAHRAVVQGGASRDDS